MNYAELSAYFQLFINTLFLRHTIVDVYEAFNILIIFP